MIIMTSIAGEAWFVKLVTCHRLSKVVVCSLYQAPTRHWALEVTPNCSLSSSWHPLPKAILGPACCFPCAWLYHAFFWDRPVRGICKHNNFCGVIVTIIHWSHSLNALRHWQLHSLQHFVVHEKKQDLCYDWVGGLLHYIALCISELACNKQL